MQATEKQLKFIKAIEKYTGNIFTGSTVKEASEYISQNIEDYETIKTSLEEIRRYEINNREHITEERYDLAEPEAGHAICPFCGGLPRLQKITVYRGRADHKWACTRYYYKNILCIKCKAQTGRILVKEEYDDSDTIYPEYYNISDSDVWKIWDTTLQKIKD